ncbi:hypothetical protein POF50_001630 [Streptomyces sp. SL13]|uniref:Uncharacterized protein n=1 Tax=Streptantibioticus silvisoli TaxID=2705255 RepID=A0AA90H3B3_9ACTN|nr:hypothetical protein [Streptantibioticus silvisoli]
MTPDQWPTALTARIAQGIREARRAADLTMAEGSRPLEWCNDGHSVILLGGYAVSSVGRVVSLSSDSIGWLALASSSRLM